MTLDMVEFCRQCGTEQSVVEVWVGVGWVRPRGDEDGVRFSEMDLARARFIQDLAGPMGVNDEGIAVVLDLIDQIHGLRGALRDVTSVISTQQISVRQQLRAEAEKIAQRRT